MKKTLITILVTVLVCCTAFGVTYAYLMEKTDPIVNTFTYGNVDIELAETTGTTYKMLPGHVYDKDPTVTVTTGSEDCWVFVKVVKSTNFDTFVSCAIADGWTLVEGQTDVYARKVLQSDTTRKFAVLANSKVTIKDVTQDELDDAKDNQPTLTITAYAVQADGFADAKVAWAQASTLG